MDQSIRIFFPTMVDLRPNLGVWPNYIGERAGGLGGASAPQSKTQSTFSGKIWAKFGQKLLFLMFKMLKIQKLSAAAPLDTQKNIQCPPDNPTAYRQNFAGPKPTF